MLQFSTLQGVQELFFSDELQFLQDCLRTCCWVICYWAVGHGVAIRRRSLEGTAKGAKERQQLGDGAEGALGEERKLQMLRGWFLTQPIQSLEQKVRTSWSEWERGNFTQQDTLQSHLRSYPISLLYPLQHSDDVRYAFLLALHQCSLWAVVAAHIHLRDKRPAIPVCAQWNRRSEIDNNTQTKCATPELKQKM